MKLTLFKNGEKNQVAGNNKNKTMNISIASLLWLISHFFLSYISSIGILSIPLVFYYSSLMYLTFTILVVLYEYKKA